MSNLIIAMALQNNFTQQDTQQDQPSDESNSGLGQLSNSRATNFVTPTARTNQSYQQNQVIFDEAAERILQNDMAVPF